MTDENAWLTAIVVIVRRFLPLYLADYVLLYDNYFDVPGYRYFAPEHPWRISLRGRELFVDDLGWWFSQVSDWGLYFLLVMAFIYLALTVRNSAAFAGTPL